MNEIEVPVSGSFTSDNGSTSFTWSMPSYSRVDHLLCEVGAHIGSRETVVRGWISYFTPVDHLYCACGRRRWIKFEGGIASCETVEPGTHLEWVRTHLESEALFARFQSEMVR